MRRINELTRFGGLVLLTILIGACKQSGSQFSFEEVSEQEMYSLLLPVSVEITPFTRPKSFDKDKVPDGVEVHIRPLDRFKDPIKAVGTYQFELYRYKQASGDRRGERLQFWEVQVATPKQVRKYWDRTSQMFQFKLGVDQIDALVPQRKYVLTVRYNSPQGRHLEDDYTFVFRLRRDQFAEAGS